MSPSPSGIGRRLRSGLGLGLLLFVLCGLVAAPISNATVSATVEESIDGAVDDTDTGTDAESGMTIDAALETESDSETVEVIVRLSEAEPAPAATSEQARVDLKRHAERTQGEVVSYARSTRTRGTTRRTP